MSRNVQKFAVPIKLAQLAADPSNPETGYMYYNTTTGLVRSYENGEWKNYIPSAEKGAASGVATLDINGFVPLSQLSGIANSNIASNAAISYSKLSIADGDLTIAKTSGLQTALNSKIASTEKGAANGVATLDANSYVPLTQISGLTSSNIAANAAIPYSKLSIADGDLTIAKTSGLQGALDAKLALAGGTMSGNIAMNNYKVIGLSNPTDASDAATKAYVDANLAGLDFQADVARYITTNTFDPGASPTTGTRYILDSATYHANFGTITGFGQGDIVQYSGTAWVVAFDVSVHTVGGVLAWSSYESSFYNWSGSTWSSFGGLSGVTAGVGLDKVGNTLSVKMGAGIIELPTGEVGLDLVTNGGLELTSLLSGGQLQIKAGGVTNDMLAGSIVYSKLSLSDGDIPQAKVNGLVTALAGKEPTISAGTSSQYYRGDKTWQTLDTAAVSENVANLYFTDVRAQTAVVVDNMTSADGDTTHAPSRNVLFDQLALKADDSVVVKSVNSKTPTAGAVTLNTDDVSEGSTNKYYHVNTARTDLIASSIVSGDTTHAPNGDSVYTALAGKLANVVEDTTPQLGGDLELLDKVLIHTSNGMRRGSSSSNFLEEQYIHAITLTASQTDTTATELTFAFASFEGCIIEYKIKEATTNKTRIGKIMVATNGTDVSLTDTFTETDDVGVIWNAVVSGSTIVLQYTTTANNKTMRCDVKRIKA